MVTPTAPTAPTPAAVAAWLRRVTPHGHDEGDRIAATVAWLEAGGWTRPTPANERQP